MKSANRKVCVVPQGTWIEISVLLNTQSSAKRRSPQGGLLFLCPYSYEIE
nr:MAG TPA: hypothetical protein [Bacteriophage sp.]